MEVKYKKISVENLVPKPDIAMRSPAGNLVNSVRVTPEGDVLEKAERKSPRFKWRFIDTLTSELLESKDVQYFKVSEDGSEQRVRPFSRTSVINTVKEASAPAMTGFIVESFYELFHPEPSIQRLLYEEAERYIKEDIVSIALFSWGRGFRQFYAICYPFTRDGKFVWIMELTQSRIVPQHMMDVPAEATPVEEVPTLEALPSVEALITT